jgi:shikimate kinase
MITKPVFLCGYTSSGKTTVGKELAKQLGVSFFDTDELLARQAGQTPQQIFAEKGEAYFRDLEHEIARQTAAYPPCVISTGGGMLISERNGKLLSEAGTIIYLNRPFEACYRSLMQNPDRPLIKNNTREELRERYEKRAVSYQTYADFTVKNDRTPQLTAQRIVEFLKTKRTAN